MKTTEPMTGLPQATRCKKRKNTYNIDLSFNEDTRPYEMYDEMPMVVKKINGQPTQHTNNTFPATKFPNPGARNMVRLYRTNKDFMTDAELKLATTIIEYMDNYGIPACLLFPTNEIMVRTDFTDMDDLKSNMNHATKHDMEYQMRLRTRMLDRLTSRNRQK